ncbi:hypothetical protein HC028_08995 [Planosporangium flavigriseum]|uniref:Uncharacterized protein n=1 Tax=Planosporangium flavigriseum TaxID=373681 RepID=A0A8J3PR71_9ACTN|nr:hypothetical protein [Planosporangium flavigriseum]NJC64639.1 hypothetical protein [Planosporangium flavigriseum]GIG76826.1 hypothetical protein Pfl04_52300 [Planosporangium flavigriseum]
MVAGKSVASGVALAADRQDDYNLEAAREGTRSFPFYGQHQAGIATPP